MMELEAIVGHNRKSKACIYLGNAGGKGSGKRREARLKEFLSKVSSISNVILVDTCARRAVRYMSGWSPIFKRPA